MVYLLCTALDLTSPESLSQCILTTHSPTILTALNNLMYGAKIIKEFPEREKHVRDVLGETDLVLPEHVRAYVFVEGEVRSIIREKAGLLEARELGEDSGYLSAELHRIMEAREGGNPHLILPNQPSPCGSLRLIRERGVNAKRRSVFFLCSLKREIASSLQRWKSCKSLSRSL